MATNRARVFRSISSRHLTATATVLWLGVGIAVATGCDDSDDKPAATADGGTADGGGTRAGDGGVLVSGKALPFPYFAIGAASLHADGGAAGGGAPDAGAIALPVDAATVSLADAGAVVPDAALPVDAKEAPADATVAPPTSSGEPEFTNLGIAIVDPNLQIINSPAAILASGPLTPATCTATGCDFAFPNVNLSGVVNLGLVGILSDLRPTPLWVKTGSGAGEIAEINGAKVSGVLANRRLFAVSYATSEKIAAFVRATTGSTTPKDAAELVTGGFMLGVVTDATGMQPVAGATASFPTPAGQAPKARILYPSADLKRNQPATSASGVFVVTPTDAAGGGAVVSQWTIAGPAGDTRTWPLYTAGLQPGSVFVLVFLAR